MLHIKLQERSLEHYVRKMFDHMHTFDLLGWVNRSNIEMVMIRVIPKMNIGVGEIGLIFCGKHPLFVTRTKVSDPGPTGPLVLYYSIINFSSLYYS